MTEGGNALSEITPSNNDPGQTKSWDAMDASILARLAAGSSHPGAAGPLRPDKSVFTIKHGGNVDAGPAGHQAHGP
jgi:hypothetical protein